MPASPQDFALWSNLTGNPYPQTPAERMALSPEVYQYTKNIGRRGGPSMSPIRRALDVAGKAALAAGAVAGAAYLGDKYFKGQENTPGSNLNVTDDGSVSNMDAVDTAEPTAVSVPPKGATTEQIITALGRAKATPRASVSAGYDTGEYDKEGDDLYLQHQWQSHRRNVSGRVQEYLGRTVPGFGKLALDDAAAVSAPRGGIDADPQSQAVRASADITPPTTSQHFNQSVVPKQTSLVQSAEGVTPITQSAVIANQQQFSPGTAEEMVGQDSARKAEAFRKSAAYTVMQREYPNLAEIQSPGEAASAIPGRMQNVQPSPQIRVAGASTEDRPPSVSAPREPVSMAATVGGPSRKEIYEVDKLLERSMSGHTPEQRMSIRDQMFAKKYKTASAPIVTTEQSTPIRVAQQSTPAVSSGPSQESVRFARETARGMGRVGLLAQREARGAKLTTQAMTGTRQDTPSFGEEQGESADPRLMRELLRRGSIL
jgi:hypothetical protein